MSRRVAKMMRRFLLAGGIGLAVGGCVHNWDEFTSRDFKFKDMFRPSDPMTVLRDNPDGDARAKAMAQLKEPKKQGGSDALQDEAVNRLASQAVSAPEPLCRLAAVDALGRFDDPRTAAPLIQAYHSAANEKTFTPDVVSAIQTQTLLALGHKHSPEATALLIQAASKSVQKPSGVQQTGFVDTKSLLAMDGESPSAREARLTAVRALGMSGDPKAIPVLLPLLSEKDVSIRDRAHEALQAITKRKDVPKDAKAWEAAIGGTDKVNLHG